MRKEFIGYFLSFPAYDESFFSLENVDKMGGFIDRYGLFFDIFCR